MKITVIGTGYVGIVTAVTLADFGHDVVGLDVDPNRIANLKKAISPIYEPGLEELIKKGIKNKRLKFTTSYQEALSQSSVIFICVGTPQSEAGEVDVTYVKAATKSIAQNLANPSIIVLKSTVPPGIHRDLAKIMDKDTKVAYEFASNPEFLREGSAIADTFNPERIVIGTDSVKAKEILASIHQDFPGERIYTDTVSAQMIKYTANSFLATKISFANAIARTCDLLGADVTTVMRGVGLDSRIGEKFLSPGLGYGGSCFPKDVKGLYFLAKNAGYNFKLLAEVENINQEQFLYYLTKAKKALKTFQNKKIAILGLAFKPETDDMRDAKSIDLIKALLTEGAQVSTYDPVASDNARKSLGEKVEYCSTALNAIKNSDALFLVTEWNEFRNLDFVKIKSLMKGDVIVDARNLWQPEKLKELGFNYIAVGRKLE